MECGMNICIKVSKKINSSLDTRITFPFQGTKNN